jgi:hypothetical protein
LCFYFDTPEAIRADAKLKENGLLDRMKKRLLEKTPDQIAELKENYRKLKTIDPEGYWRAHRRLLEMGLDLETD